MLSPETGNCPFITPAVRFLRQMVAASHTTWSPELIYVNDLPDCSLFGCASGSAPSLKTHDKTDTMAGHIHCQTIPDDCICSRLAYLKHRNDPWTVSAMVLLSQIPWQHAAPSVSRGGGTLGSNGSTMWKFSEAYPWLNGYRSDTCKLRLRFVERRGDGRAGAWLFIC